MEFEKFLKNMAPEMVGIADELQRKGYKIDGHDGIKIYCGLNTLNSADYIDTNHDLHDIVEFTDLIAQYKMAKIDAEILSNEAELSKKNPDWRIQRKILSNQCNEIKAKVHRELVEKFIKSWTIVEIAKLKIKAPPENIKKTPRAIVVIATEDTHEHKLEPIELARLLSKINDVLTTNLPEDLYSDHIVCDIHKFTAADRVGLANLA